jgi:hypothetical protein
MHVSRLRLILSVFVASLVFLDARRGSFSQSSVLYPGDQIMVLFLVTRGKFPVSMIYIPHLKSSTTPTT